MYFYLFIFVFIIVFGKKERIFLFFTAENSLYFQGHFVMKNSHKNFGGQVLIKFPLQYGIYKGEELNKFCSASFICYLDF